VRKEKYLFDSVRPYKCSGKGVKPGALQVGEDRAWRLRCLREIRSIKNKADTVRLRENRVKGDRVMLIQKNKRMKRILGKCS
jgi:hypothetical protein